MRAFLLAILMLISTWQNAQNISVAKPTGYINDFANLFSQEEQDSLFSAIIEYELKTTNQIAIITITPKMIGDYTIERYTLSVLNSWGVGQKEKNNGIVIGIYQAKRQIRIENGYGIEKVFSDEEAKKIIEEDFIPLFREGEYFKGTYKGLMAIINKVPAI